MSVITTMDIVGRPVTLELLKEMVTDMEKAPVVGAKQLAQALGISTRRVTQLVDEGHLFRKGRNQYNLMECSYNFVLYQRRLAVKESLELKE